MTGFLVAFGLLAFLALCVVAYRCGFGWRTPSVYDPFTVTTFGQRNHSLPSKPNEVDLRPGGITPFDSAYEACQCK